MTETSRSLKSGEIRYFIEKSSNVVYKLLTGKGDARSRLKENELEIRFLLAFKIPVHLQKLKNALNDRLTKNPELRVGDFIIMTSFQRSVGSMRNSSAAKIIADFYSLHMEMKMYKDQVKNY